nr:septal ring lytic transglycosylase RlpA family protein [Gandjariella thermophila]
MVVLSAAAAIGFTAFSNPESHAAENCAGLDQALQNNLNFIAAQQANPDAQSAARIANRQAVVNLIQQRRAAAGCTNNITAQAPASSQAAASSSAPAQAAGAANNNAGQAGNAAANGGAAGQVVCPGSTVTLSGEGGAPAATSNQFPVGTTLKVTNLDNNKSTTVKVNGVSGSCVLLNNAAFDQVREAGKNLIRHARIEKVG